MSGAPFSRRAASRTEADAGDGDGQWRGGDCEDAVVTANRCNVKMHTVTVFGARPEQKVQHPMTWISESPFEAPPDGPHFDL